MTVGHIFGIPVEESVLQIAPAAAVTATIVTMAGRSTLNRFLDRIRRQ